MSRSRTSTSTSTNEQSISQQALTRQPREFAICRERRRPEALWRLRNVRHRRIDEVGELLAETQIGQTRFAGLPPYDSPDALSVFRADFDRYFAFVRFFVLGFLAHRIYTGEPPIPGKVVDPNGGLLFTHFLIRNGRILKKQNRLQMSQVFPFPC
jgi:hypothetical protein